MVSPGGESMKRYFLIALVLLTCPAIANAGKLEKALQRRWLGAWVVTTVETYSNCGNAYTTNRLNGKLVSSQGRNNFRSGELAKLVRVDVKRSRLDLLMTLRVPKLLPRQEGPFTLYDERECRIELEVALPRAVVKNKDVRGIETVLSAVVRRHTSEDEARSSRSWNRREREEYPDDYELTLAKLEIWRAEQTNLKVQERLDLTFEEATRLTDRLSSDASYLAGLARGIEAGKAVKLTGCGSLLSVNLTGPKKPPVAQASQANYQSRSDRGFKDGRMLVLSLELLRRLPECFVEVPEPPGKYR